MRPWGAIDPNTEHQLWSRWTFRVFASRTMPIRDVEENAGRWLRMGFGSVGRFRVEQERVPGGQETTITAEVEGAPAHDPGYVASVEREFARFVSKGWGVLARGEVSACILAGDAQDGRPPTQLVVLPRVALGGLHG